MNTEPIQENIIDPSNTNADISVSKEKTPLADIRSCAEKLKEAASKIPSKDSPQPDSLATQASLLRLKADAYCSLVDFTKTFSNNVNHSPERSKDVAVEIMPIVVSKFRKQIKELSSHKSIPSSAKRFCQVYVKSESTPKQLPSWYSATIDSLVVTQDNSPNLPDPFKYLYHSKSSKAQAETLLDRRVAARQLVNQANAEINRVEQKGGTADYSTVDREQLKIAQIDQEADKLLFSITDVNPADVPDCITSVGLKMFPSPEQIEEAVTLLKDITSIISELVTSKSKEEALPDLLEDFVRLRQALLDTLPQLPLDRRIKNKTSNAKELISNNLNDIFPGNSINSSELILLLAEYNNPKINTLLPSLTAARVQKSSARGGSEQGFAIESEKNSPLTTLLVEHLTFKASDELFEEMSDALSQSSMSTTIKLCGKIRVLANEKNPATIAKVLDSEIEEQLEKKFTNDTELKALIAVITAIAKNKELVSQLKGRLRNRRKVTELCDKATEKSGKQSELARVLDRNKQIINKAFSYTLEDYWGQQQLKADVCSIIDGNLLLIQEPERYQGLPPKTAFLNGILLYGIPGVGKSFLVECIANQYGLEKTIISREDMYSALHKTSQKGGQSQPERIRGEELKTSIHQFFKNKVEDGRKKMEQSGAKSFIVFIDEMEAEFLKRDPATSPRLELDETNIMLRVLEQVMEDNPDVLFVGATNFLELVDNAAKRLGRFGIKLSVEPAKEDDVIEIITGTLQLLGLDYEILAKSDKMTNLISSCIGMTPFPIQNAITHAFVTSNIDRESPDIDACIDLFAKKIEFIKRVTDFQPPQQDENGSQQNS